MIRIDILHLETFELQLVVTKKKTHVTLITRTIIPFLPLSLCALMINCCRVFLEDKRRATKWLSWKGICCSCTRRGEREIGLYQRGGDTHAKQNGFRWEWLGREEQGLPDLLPFFLYLSSSFLFFLSFSLMNIFGFNLFLKVLISKMIGQILSLRFKE